MSTGHDKAEKADPTDTPDCVNLPAETQRRVYRLAAIAAAKTRIEESVRACFEQFQAADGYRLVIKERPDADGYSASGETS